MEHHPAIQVILAAERFEMGLNVMAVAILNEPGYMVRGDTVDELEIVEVPWSRVDVDKMEIYYVWGGLSIAADVEEGPYDTWVTTVPCTATHIVAIASVDGIPYTRSVIVQPV